MTALKATQGWGGDHYQVYYNDVISQTVLAADWVWDTPRDATEFKSAMTEVSGRAFSRREDRSGGR